MSPHRPDHLDPTYSDVSPEPTDGLAASRARRREQRRALRRRREHARRDLAIGTLVAIAALILAPGLAIVALLAAAVLVGCFVSIALERVRRR